MSTAEGRVLGRYVLSQEIGSGGMATVHLGRLVGPAGFSRTVAIKRLHARLAKDPVFATMFLDEARLASRVRHPNVVPIVDVGLEAGELFLVMDYVHGETLGKLIPAARASGGVPPAIAVAVLTGVLRGLHAAHEAKSEKGAPLDLVHRDVSPQNVLIGADGLARVLDFGVAKAIGRLQTTRDGSLKGKFSYMAREQLAGERVDRRADIYAASVVLWETLAGRRLFPDGSRLPTALGEDRVEPPSAIAKGIPPALDAVVLRGLARASDRWMTAEAMASALEEAMPPATQGKVAAWIADVAAASLAAKEELVASVEGGAHAPDRTLPTAQPVAAIVARAPAEIELMPESDRIAIPVHGGGRRLIGVVAIAAVGLVAALAVHFASTPASPAIATPAALDSAPIGASAAPAIPIPVASSAVTPSLPPPIATATIAAPPPPRPSAVRAKTPPPASCSPPYTVDDRGIRYPKPECL